MNLWSGSREGNGLAAALTNPTEISRRKGTVVRPYPVVFRGREWPDAEAAYLRYKEEEDRDELMTEVILCKLRQHPRIGLSVKGRGGVEFLESCVHRTYARTEEMRSWEGSGSGSRFIRNLISAYGRWLRETFPEGGSEG